MGHTPFHWQSLTALAHLIQSGTLSPVDLTEHFLTRLEALDDTLHAFRLVTRERALAEARVQNSPCVMVWRSGHCTAFSTPPRICLMSKVCQPRPVPLLQDNIAARDATVIRTLRQAGMILLGKTNTVQFAYGGWGLTTIMARHNPWHATPHVPGGSSSGSAVAVAAGLPPWRWGVIRGVGAAPRRSVAPWD